MGRRHRPRITRHNYAAIVDQEFREIERERRLRASSRPDAAERDDPTVYSTDPDPLSDTDAFLHALRHVEADDRHPDTIGVSRRPEPKSITSALPHSKIGSIPRPKSPPKKPKGGGPIALWKGNDSARLNPYIHRHYGSGDK